MAKTELTVRQIMNLGLWDRVCEYKDWNPYILNEGRISEDEIVEFDDEFKKPDKSLEKTVTKSISSLLDGSNDPEKIDELFVQTLDDLLEDLGNGMDKLEKEKALKNFSVFSRILFQDFDPRLKQTK